MKENFTEDGEEWQKKVYTDQEETKEVQENRIEYFKKKGDQQFTEEGRTAEITVDLMLYARAKISNNKVKWAGRRHRERDDEAFCPWRRSALLRSVFRERFLGQMESPSSWNIMKLVFLRKTLMLNQRKGSEATRPLH